MAYIHEHVHGDHIDEIHHYDGERHNNTGNIIGLIVLIILIALLLTYGVPILRNLASYTTPHYTTPQINVPGKINVNVNTPQK